MKTQTFLLKSILLIFQFVLFEVASSQTLWDNQLIGLVPANDSILVKSKDSLVLTFDKNITNLSGNVRVFTDESNIVDSVDLQSSSVSGVGSKIIRIKLHQPLNLYSSYYINVDSNAFGKGFKGIYNNTDWHFSLNYYLGEIIHSNVMNVDYKLFISYPQDYNPKRVTPYPIVYFLDGNWMLNEGKYLTLLDMMKLGNDQEAIIVGIGYPSNKDFDVERERDYLFSARADDFFTFIKTEVLPFVEKSYNVDTKERTLLGYSHGGHFSAYMLMKYSEPANRLFKNVLSGDATLFMTDAKGNMLMDYLTDYFNTVDSIPVNWFISSGSDPVNSNHDIIEQWVNIVKNRTHKGFKYHYFVVPNSDHGGASVPSFEESMFWFNHLTDTLVIFPPYPQNKIYCDMPELKVDTLGQPSGGIYTGNDLVNGFLYPQKLKLGDHLVTYQYTFADGTTIDRTYSFKISGLDINTNQNLWHLTDPIWQTDPSNSVIDTFKLAGFKLHNNSTYSLVIGDGINDVDNNLFSIKDAQLILNKPIDYGVKKVANIFIRGISPEGDTCFQSFVFNVTPVTIRLFNAFTINNSTPVGYKVGRLRTNVLTEKFEYYLGKGDGLNDIDNQYFEIINDTLFLKKAINPSITGNLKICVYAKCGDGIPTNSALEIKYRLTDVEQLSDNDFEIYPNPTSSQVFIKYNNSSTYYQIKIYNITGNLLLVKSLNNSQLINQIDLDGLTKGIYFLEIADKKHSQTRKIVLH